MLRRGALLAAAVTAAIGLGACGSSGSGTSGPAASSNPTTLLRQTFAATHSVKSGVIDVSLVISPKGSTELRTPLSLSLSGPFEDRGSGTSPESSFTIAFSGLGRHGSLGVTTTASGAYVALDGVNYALPSADFHKLQSTLAAKSSSSTPGLSSLGIDPEHWISAPQIIGTETVDGVVCEHVRAAIDVTAFVQSLNQVLAKESSTLHSATGGSKLPSHITAAQIAQLAALIHNPTLDVWTGKSDSTLRRLVISAEVAIPGTMSTELGGLTSAGVRLTINYSDLGRPQTITTPSDVHTYAQLQAKLQTLGASLDGLGSSGTTSGGSSGQVSKYGRCIDSAGGDVAKMQKCAALLGSG